MKRKDKRVTGQEVARGVGQYVGMMYSVEALDKIIAYLEAERARIYSILMEPLKPKKESERKP